MENKKPESIINKLTTKLPFPKEVLEKRLKKSEDGTTESAFDRINKAIAEAKQNTEKVETEHLPHMSKHVDSLKQRTDDFIESLRKIKANLHKEEDKQDGE